MNKELELRNACFILKARMTNKAAVERYLNKDKAIDNQWKAYNKDLWSRGIKRK